MRLMAQVWTSTMCEFGSSNSRAMTSMLPDAATGISGPQTSLDLIHIPQAEIIRCA